MSSRDHNDEQPQEQHPSQVKIDTGHDDLIHDIRYDYYGKRLATCASDMRIKVWDYDHDADAWALNDSWRGHDCSILRVSWAHPEFGNVIASCSFDRTVKIWEEQESAARGSGKRWRCVATLGEHRGAVHGVEFAPSHQGLRLLTASSDGHVRVYEAADIVQLSQWQLLHEVEVIPDCSESERLAISWCPSRFEREAFVVGGGSKMKSAKVYEIDHSGKGLKLLLDTLGDHEGEITDVAWAPNMGRSFNLIATASKDQRVRIFKVTEDVPEKSGSTNISNSSSGVGLGGMVGGGGSFGSDVATLGSNYTASGKHHRGGHSGGGGSSKAGSLKATLVATMDDHHAEVWRVDWNVLGTILSSSGDDGTVRLWKSTYIDEWKCLNIVNVEAAPV